MGSKTDRKSNPAKARSSTSKQNKKQSIVVKQAAKKKHQKLPKDQSERVRDALNRDMDLLYNALENPSTSPLSVGQTDSVVSLAEASRLCAFDDDAELLVDDLALALIIPAFKAGVIFLRKTGQGGNDCPPPLLRY